VPQILSARPEPGRPEQGRPEPAHPAPPRPAPVGPAPVGRVPTAAAVAVVVVGLAGTVAAAVLDALVSPAHRAATELDLGWTAGVSGLALALPGALLLALFPRHPIAWVLSITGLHWIVDGAAASWLAYATARRPALPGAELAFWFFQRVGALLLLSLPLVLLLYPNGRLPGGRWRIAALASLASTALLPLVLLVVPSDVAQSAAGTPLPAPLHGLDLDLTTMTGLPDGAWTVLLRVAFAAVPLSLLVPFAVVVRRYRRATGTDRARMRWLVWAGVVDVLVMLSALVFP
jgi:hypothetical protein